MTDWDGTRNRIDALADSPAAERVFGWHGHEFRLADPLTETELEEAEWQFGVRLPEEYRTFLQQVGRGGAGPAYGLLPLTQDEHGRWAWPGGDADLTDTARLAEPFPAHVADPAALAAMQQECPAEESFAAADDFDAAVEHWEERLASQLWDEDRTVGAVYLCDEGCGLRVWLAVAGPEAGAMWRDVRVDHLDFEPVRGEDGRPLHFAEWYSQWLEAAERRVAHVPA